MTTQITFIRHGQSQANLDKVIAGFLDTPLTIQGIKESVTIADTIKNEHFDIAFCSPLTRAKQTFTEINKYHNLKVVYDNRLKERNYGEYENTPYDYINNDIKGIDFWRLDKNINYDTAENVLDFYKRVEDFFNYIKTNYYSKKVLIVAHGGVYKIIYCMLYGMPKDFDLLKLNFGNANIFKFEL